MTDRIQDTARNLMRRAHTTDPRAVAFDVETGLREVLGRVPVPVTPAELAGTDQSAASNGLTAPQHQQVARAVERDASLPSGHVMVAELPGPDARPWEGLAGHDRHAACLIAAQTGDRTALDVLVAELTPLIWHVARGRGLDRETAEDVVQTVWLALLRHLDQLTAPRALVRWLIITTRHEAARSHRRHATQFELTPQFAEHLASNDPTPEASLLHDERDRQLWAAFHRLSPRCQELLRMTVLAGRAEYRAVAEELTMSRGSIGPTRGRCLSSLRTLYEMETGQ